MSRLFRVTVFCGSRLGASPAFETCAVETGRLAASRGIGVVYGGGSIGLMGKLADSCLAHGGEVDGVLPTNLFKAEVAHTAVTRLHSVEDMHTRKALMTRLCDAFLVLPGGFGTLDEMFEALTWRQIGVHGKPLALVNVDGFFDGLLAFIDNTRAQGFVPAEPENAIIVARTPDEALTALLAFDRRHTE
jgi:uncharacterized protein (TIGR00730 family)